MSNNDEADAAAGGMVGIGSSGNGGGNAMIRRRIGAVGGGGGSGGSSSGDNQQMDVLVEWNRDRNTNTNRRNTGQQGRRQQQYHQSILSISSTTSAAAGCGGCCSNDGGVGGGGYSSSSLGGSSGRGCFSFGGDSSAAMTRTTSMKKGKEPLLPPSSSSTSPQGDGDERMAINTDVEDVIAKAMNQLSMKDRENALQDIHCVVDDEDDQMIRNIESNPNKVNEYREQLNQELQNQIRQYKLKQLHSSRGGRSSTNTSTAQKKELCAYEQALQINSSYVTNDQFQLLFLRDTKYNIQDAANKIFHFMEEKLQLWGLEKLCSDITLEDFDTVDLRYMNEGYFQHLPIQDRIGRDIMVVYLHFPQYCTAKNVCRCIYYVIMSIHQRQQERRQRSSRTTSSNETTTTSSSSSSSMIGGIVELVYRYFIITYDNTHKITN